MVTRDASGDPERSAERRFFDSRTSYTAGGNCRAHLADIFKGLFLEFIDDVRKARAQRLGDLGASQNSRDAFMAFDKADCGAAQSGLLRQFFMGKALLLTQTRKFINDFFYQQFRRLIPHEDNDPRLAKAFIGNYSY